MPIPCFHFISVTTEYLHSKQARYAPIPDIILKIIQTIMQQVR